MIYGISIAVILAAVGGAVGGYMAHAFIGGALGRIESMVKAIHGQVVPAANPAPVKK